MKTLGLVRNLDNLGRITLPMELRRTLGIKEGDPLEIYVEGKLICLKAVKSQCVCCGSTEADELFIRNGVHICIDCISELHEEALK